MISPLLKLVSSTLCWLSSWESFLSCPTAAPSRSPPCCSSKLGGSPSHSISISWLIAYSGQVAPASVSWWQSIRQSRSICSGRFLRLKSGEKKLRGISHQELGLSRDLDGRWWSGTYGVNGNHSSHQTERCWGAESLKDTDLKGLISPKSYNNMHRLNLLEMWARFGLTGHLKQVSRKLSSVQMCLLV